MLHFVTSFGFFSRVSAGICINDLYQFTLVSKLKMNYLYTCKYLIVSQLDMNQQIIFFIFYTIKNVFVQLVE